MQWRGLTASVYVGRRGGAAGAKPQDTTIYNNTFRQSRDHRSVLNFQYIKVARYLSRSSALPRRRAATACSRRNGPQIYLLSSAIEYLGYFSAGRRMEASGSGCSGGDGGDLGPNVPC
eukprot:6187238-Pleurochrysis_carterae.AAC.1